MLPKAYEPAAVEEKWYKRWTDAGCFTADPSSAKPGFSIVIPPPNVTGVLTLGHVLNNTLQDILARRARMMGYETLWLPGTDHAGIATQTVVERRLRRDEGKTRHDLGREAFLERVWQWKEQHGGIIIEQLKRLGCSCDWSRERFTMDPEYARLVQEVFVALHAKGLIYRGRRMVNWCPVSRTALSDEEVIPKPQSSLLYKFRVEVVEEPGTFLEIATTRPETIMGDTGVAVNPADPRYRRFIGLHVRRPLPVENQAAIRIVGDEAVDFEFGTGVLKVTPAHDKVDYEIGQRHGLEIIDILHPDGTLNALAGAEFEGLDRFVAREKAADSLAQLGLLITAEPYENTVGFSERADVPVEPRLSDQWFLRYPKTSEAREVVRNGTVRFYPERWEKVYDHWLENIQDWCISRQLWWGHRVPAWWRTSASGERECAVAIDQPEGEGWEQDPDVLDTWFSSWLWAHGTMPPDVRAKFYPTDALVTGPDIIFFWVARMIMAGLEFTGEIPFRHVFFTGIIRDREGRKMSKSLGNSPDPLDLIARYGADGIRFGMMRIAPQGQDIRFDEKQLEEGRNFANKLWNAARFREMHGPSQPRADLSRYALPKYAVAVIAQFDAMHARWRNALAEYRFNEGAALLYDFFWNDYCDWFVEAAKSDIHGTDPARKAAVLESMDFVLSALLRLLHPYMPHITEELWATMGFSAPTHSPAQADFLMMAAMPDDESLTHLAAGDRESALSETAAVYECVRAVRNLRAEYKVPSNKPVRLQIVASRAIDAESRALVEILTRAEGLESISQRPAHTPSALTPLGEIFLPLAGLLDVEAEKKRLGGEADRVRAEIGKVDAKLANANFVQNAPPAVVEEHRARRLQWEEKLAALELAIASLG